MLYLRHIEDIRTIAFTLIYFILFGIQWLYTWNSGYKTGIITISLWLWTCWFSFVAAVATHNCIHCPMFTNKNANKVFQIALSLAYGHPVSAYVPGHNLSHHKYTQQRKDVMRTTKVRFRWHFLNGITFFFKIGYDMIGNDSTYFRVQSQFGRPIVKQLRLEQVILYTIAAILAIWDFKRWFMIAFLPHAYAKFCIITLNLLQHDGCDMESKYDFARNFTGGIINWFCYNNGYHTIHHLHPGMHWSILPEQHDKLMKPYMHTNLAQDNIVLYIWRTFVWPGIRIDFKGVPLVLPPATNDEPWFYEDTETYSSKNDHFQ